MKRRAALGLIGGFAAVAVGAAPPMHKSTDLDVDVDLHRYYYGNTVPVGVEHLSVDLANHTGETLHPVWFTWDQRRKTRHNWDIKSGPEALEAGEAARYELHAPGEDAEINDGYRAQLTVFQRGEQRWHSIQFTPEAYPK